jgi:LuxR family maltose regulon positive regulatory protein
MPITLLQTKLHVPAPRAELVPRPRLTQRLIAGLGGRLTLISAPAGFGKTTLVCEGIRASQMPTGWVSLDEADNDPTHFWAYIIAALRTIQPNLGKTAMNMLEAPAPHPWNLS